jgi:predicted dehydrogenase
MPRFSSTRRDFLAGTGAAAAASAFAGLSVPTNAHAAEDNLIQVALIGSGGRGTGAAGNALAVQDRGPIKLVAMADVFPDKMKKSYRTLNQEASDRMDVPEERQFLGFDAYKKAMDCLKPGDIAILATPPAFRWPMYEYAIEKGLNVFMEKPVTIDAPTSKRMLAINEEAVKKNLKVAVGLMCRHCRVRQEMIDRIRNGEIGDLTLLRAYRVAGPTGTGFAGPKPEGLTELEYQIRRFHSFLWASGGAFSDFLIHNIDECCWVKDAWPIEAKGYGGRHYRGDSIDQNFDVYSTEYTFPDGTKLMLQGRCMEGCDNEFASFAHGTKGSAVISSSGHSPAKCKLYNSQEMVRKNLTWSYPGREPNPYQTEWDDFVAAIREDKPYNEVERGVRASLVTTMGRMACHTGKTITWDEIQEVDHEFAPNIKDLNCLDCPPPLQMVDGKYPVPEPGIKTKREF